MTSDRLGDPSVCWTRGRKIHITTVGVVTLCGRTPVYPSGLGDVLYAYGDLCRICQRRYVESAGERVADAMQAALSRTADDDV